MNQDVSFSAKVDTALREIMIHVSRCEQSYKQRGYSTRCVEPDHALQILAKHGMTVANKATADVLFDSYA